MKNFSTNQLWLLYGILFLTCSLAFVPAVIAPPGLENPEPIGQFLNGNLPSSTPTGSVEGYEVVDAFPNLRFRDPLVILMHPLENTMFVATRQGVIYQFENRRNVTQANLVADMSDRTAVVWDGGFLGMVFHPEFGQPNSPNNKYVYAYYAAVGSNGERAPGSFRGFTCPDNAKYYGTYLRLSRFEVDLNSLTINKNTERQMFNIRLYNETHRGGGMVFGNDGFLYLTIGDQARNLTSQDISDNFEGGVIRIDVDRNTQTSHPVRRKMGEDTGNSDEFTGVGYYIPNDNPFQNTNGSIFEEFYTVGNRAPHRMTKDRLTGEMWIGEVGGGRREEINVLKKGGNYGWPKHEGNLVGTESICGSNQITLTIGDYTGPVVDFLRSEANAIIGGYVYRGSKMPSLYGKYICGGYSQNRIFSVTKPQGSSTGTKTVIGSFSPGGMMTFGEDHEGELYIGKQGNNVPIYTLQEIGGSSNAPTLLSQTGAFKNLSTLEPEDGVIPYDMIEPFYSDNAEKKRWLAIPNNGTHNTSGEQIGFSENGDWTFPEGAVLIKHFEFPGKRLETRFEVHGEGGYYYLTYKWNDAGTDATLLTGALDEVVTVNGQQQTWHYPSRDECTTCHQNSVGSVLGLKTRHLNKEILYPKSGLTANQLVTLSHLGILNENITDGDVQNYLTMASQNDGSKSLEFRARSYLDVNCSYCHRPETGNRASFNSLLTVPLDQQGYLFGSVFDDLGINGAKIVFPGDHQKSVLFHRMEAVGNNIAMPPLAKDVADTEGVQLIKDWINSMDVDPNILLVQGNAFPSGDCYELTSATQNQRGTAWSQQTIDLEQNFTLEANINLGSANGGADGLTFALIGESVGNDALGDGGGSLGLGGISPSFGVDFDTYDNGSVDISNDHIGFWANGNVFSSLQSTVCASSNCANIEDGNDHAIKIEWDASQQLMQVYFDGNLRTSYAGNIVSQYFSGNSNVYWGFGAGTGGAVNNQKVCNPTLFVEQGSICENPQTTYLSDLAYNATPQNGWGPIERDRSNGETGATDGNTLTINGQTYAKGLGVHAFSTAEFNLNKSYNKFLAEVGVDDEVGGNGSVQFDVYVDNVLVYRSPVKTGADGASSVNVSVENADVLRLEVTDAGNGIGYDHANWANARLESCNAPPANSAPIAQISANPTSGTVPLTVNFDGSGSSDSDGTISTYAWDFGDGNSGNGSSASHTYNQTGSFTASLIVTDDDGAKDTATVAVTVAEPTNQPPTASFTASSTSGPAPLAVNFDGSASSDPEGRPLTYAWDFGDGNSGAGQTVSHTYQSSGNFTATLTVTDEGGLSDDDTEAISVEQGGGNGETETLAVIADAYTNNASAGLDVNTGGSTKMFVRNKSSWGYETYLKFDISEFESVSSATLQVTGSNPSNNLPVQVGVYGTSDGWTELGITKRNAPDAEGALLDQKTINGTEQYYQWDVTSFVNAQVQNDGVASFNMKSLNSDYERVLFNTRESNNGVPQLVVTGVKRSGSKLPQSIAFDLIEDKLTTDTDVTVFASASSGLPVEINVVSGPASINGNMVSLTGLTGKVTLRATQAGNDTYEAAAPVERSFNVISPQAEEQILSVIADAQTNNASTTLDQNYGAKTFMEARNKISWGYTSYLKFDLASLTSVNSAKLRVYGNNPRNDLPVNIQVSGTTDGWTELGITANNAPATGGALGTFEVSGSAATYYEIDVTAYVQGELSNDQTASFVVAAANIDNERARFNTKEAGVFAPELVVTGDVPSTRKRQPTSLAIEAAWSLNAYPNPFSEELTVQYTGEMPEGVTIRLVDMLGKVVFEEHEVYSEKRLLISRPGESGVYLLQVIYSGKILESMKVVRSNY